MATKTSEKAKQNTRSKKSGTKKKKRSAVPVIVACSAGLVLIGGGAAAYYVGRSDYDGKFLANTYINDVDVSGKTVAEAQHMLARDDLPAALTVVKQDGGKVVVKLEDFGYSYDTDEQIQSLYDNVDHNGWLSALSKEERLTFEDTASYDKDKLKSLLEDADWGSAKNENAEILETDSGFEIKDAVQGDEMEYKKLQDYIISSVDSGKFQLEAADSDCYIKPEITAEDLQGECDMLNSVYNMEINYDFDYTKEKLTGKKLMDMVELDENGVITADPDKAMKYVEYLAEKYDTYNTERKFHATIQGDITVPISDDAKYGWWIDQQRTCDQLVDMLELGESVESVDPIYYETGGYVFTGYEKARTKDDDIGKTYIEIDLTNQKFWYYKNGKKVKECDIVSGQTTSAARTTLPGVYKVWDKATNYRMKDTNADGDSWDTTCAYWTRVAICGIGLHDSQWRYAFGGNIYKYNGSHGCINMPLEYAKFVHDKVPMGTPVVMYY